MSVSVSIQAAKMPINYNLVFVCRKIGFNSSGKAYPIDEAIKDINDIFQKMNDKELNFSKTAPRPLEKL